VIVATSDTTYPRTVTTNGFACELRLVTAADEDLMLAFATALPEEDMRFLRTDITQRPALRGWLRSIEEGRRVAVAALHDGVMVGFGSVNRREQSWFRHLGEIRVLVSRSHRGTGIGSVLAREILDLAHEAGLRKLAAQMAKEQEGARRLFERLGFTVEALLTDWVIDRDGRTHDMILMSHDATGLTD
jgi:L-amino acid N-acyltransferase YncA